MQYKEMICILTWPLISYYFIFRMIWCLLLEWRGTHFHIFHGKESVSCYPSCNDCMFYALLFWWFCIYYPAALKASLPFFTCKWMSVECPAQLISCKPTVGTLIHVQSSGLLHAFTLYMLKTLVNPRIFPCLWMKWIVWL